MQSQGLKKTLKHLNLSDLSSHSPEHIGSQKQEEETTLARTDAVRMGGSAFASLSGDSPKQNLSSHSDLGSLSTILEVDPGEIGGNVDLHAAYRVITTCKDLLADSALHPQVQNKNEVHKAISTFITAFKKELVSIQKEFKENKNSGSEFEVMPNDDPILKRLGELHRMLVHVKGSPFTDQNQMDEMMKCVDAVKKLSASVRNEAVKHALKHVYEIAEKAPSLLANEGASTYFTEDAVEGVLSDDDYDQLCLNVKRYEALVADGATPPDAEAISKFTANTSDHMAYAVDQEDVSEGEDGLFFTQIDSGVSFSVSSAEQIVHKAKIILGSILTDADDGSPKWFYAGLRP